ncbi:hypothetical protein [Kibdelosporangium persicum]|nr:hypothetical protein [Kibdelosporangium persicum]
MSANDDSTPHTSDPDVVWVPIRRDQAAFPAPRRAADSGHALPWLTLVASGFLLLSAFLPWGGGIGSSDLDDVGNEIQPVAWVVAGGGGLLMLPISIVAVVRRRPRLTGWGILPGFLGLVVAVFMFIVVSVGGFVIGVGLPFTAVASLVLLVCGFVALVSVRGETGKRASRTGELVLGGLAGAGGAVLAVCGASTWVEWNGRSPDRQAVSDALDVVQPLVVVMGLVVLGMAALHTARRRPRSLGWLVALGLVSLLLTGYFALGTGVARNEMGEHAMTGTDALFVGLIASAALVVVGFAALARPKAAIPHNPPSRT